MARAFFAALQMRLAPFFAPRQAPEFLLAGFSHELELTAPEVSQRVPSLADILSGIWMAVPKKKVSKARRGARNAPKYLRWDNSIHMCPKCSLPRRPHTYCDQFNCGRPDPEGALEVKQP